MQSLPTNVGIAWKLVSDFNQIDSLFKEQELPYKVITHVCSCQAVHVQIVQQDDVCYRDDYVCEQCFNDTFYSANAFLSHGAWYAPITSTFSTEVLLNLAPQIIIDAEHQQITFTVCMPIPCSVDLLREKPIYHHKSLFEVSITAKGKYHHKLHANFNLDAYYETRDCFYYEKLSDEELMEHCDVIKVYTSKLLTYLKVANVLPITKVKAQCTSLKEIAFFLTYPHLEEYEFLKWESPELLPRDTNLTVVDALAYTINYRSEKSLKKGLFACYKKRLNAGKTFDHTFIYAVTHHIRDTNLAKELIALEFGTKEDDFFESKRVAPYWNTFFIFLLSRVHKSQIVPLFKQYAKEDSFWLIDTMQLLDAIIDNAEYDTIEEHIQTIPKAKKYSYIGIHNLLSDYLRKIITDKNNQLVFEYTAKVTEPCIQSDIYTIKLPQTGLELNEWGELLHNCLAGYCNYVMDGGLSIYGFFKEAQLQFAVEVQNDKIIQASSKYNAPLSNEQKSALDAWHQRFFAKDTNIII